METTTTAAVAATAWGFSLTQGMLLLVAGLIIGALAYGFWARKRDEHSPRNSAAEKKLQQYQQTVHQHLMQTAEQVQQLGDNYQKLVGQLQHVIHELGLPNEQGQHIPPVFPSAPLHTEKSETMPKTYVDPRKK